MRIARVTGSVVCTIKDFSHQGLKLLEVMDTDENGSLTGDAYIAADGADAGIGDLVLINDDGGSAPMALGRDCILDCTIVGVVDE